MSLPFLIHALLPLYLLRDRWEAQTSAGSISPLLQTRHAPLLEEKASQMLTAPTTHMEAFNTLPGINVLFLTPAARGLEAHPTYLVLRTQAGRSGAASTAPWLWQPQQGRGRELPLWTDDSLLSRLPNFAFRGELP